MRTSPKWLGALVLWCLSLATHSPQCNLESNRRVINGQVLSFTTDVGCEKCPLILSDYKRMAGAPQVQNPSSVDLDRDLRHSLCMIDYGYQWYLLEPPQAQYRNVEGHCQRLLMTPLHAPRCHHCRVWRVFLPVRTMNQLIQAMRQLTSQVAIN
jgi:hypothetical protein